KGQFHLVERVAVEAASADASAATAARSAAAKYRIAGKFSFDDKRLSVDEFRFETGPKDDPYTADGTAFVDIGSEPNFGVTATGTQMRFDEAMGGEVSPAGLTLGDRIAAVKKAVLSLPRPQMPGHIDVKLPALLVGDTTIRDIR